MSCQNCYNGCTDIIPDKCTKYTGNNVPELGIENGDSLFSVQQSIFSFLLSVMDGTSIKPEINQEFICEKISQYLGVQELTLPNIINAILQTACDLQTQVTNVKNSVDTINTAYTLSCVSGVTDNTHTHEVLQAVITKLCSVDTALTALSLNVSTNYVKLSELNNLIAAYLSGGSTSIKLYNKMIPYTVVEFYGNITGKFDATGAGLGEWEKIYLCNGNNGTPDKRGRVSVGSTTGMGGGTLDSSVDPSVSGNPIYSLGTKYGANTVVLSTAQIPSHNHLATSVVTDTGHTHFLASVAGQSNPPFLSPTNYMASNSNYGNDGNYVLGGVTTPAPTVGLTSNNQTGITVATTVTNVGGGLGHNNVQPSIGCYYIMYIPS